MRPLEVRRKGESRGHRPPSLHRPESGGQQSIVLPWRAAVCTIPAAMAETRIEHIYNCSEDTFWNEVFFDDEYNRRLFKEALAFPVYEQVDRKETDSEIRRSIKVVPKLGPMPGPLKAVIGEGIGYQENGVYDKKTRRYTIDITPNKLADKVTIKGLLYTEPRGADKCNRVFECSVTAKIFGVGGMLEKRVIADMQESYAKGAEFTNRYLAEKSG
jgi:hypothetical protein